MGAATALALILLAPFVRELAFGLTSSAKDQGQASPAPASPLFSLSIRRMIDSELVTSLPALAPFRNAHPVLLDQSVRLLLLLPGLAMELGLYGAVLGLLLLARRRAPAVSKDPAQDAALFFSIVGLGIVLFLSSSVITNNDFGYRSVMLPQFFLLLLAAQVLGSWRSAGPVPVVPATRPHRRLLHSLTVLGAAGFVYWAVLLRAWLPVETHRPQNGFSPLPEDAFQIREAFTTLDRLAPKHAVVTFRPIDPTVDRKEEVMAPNEFYQRLLVMNAGRQMLNAEGKCATHFGGDPASCPAIQQTTAQLYAMPSPSADWARAYCRRFEVQYLVMSSWDPDWPTRTGWPVTLPAVAQEPRFRILQCQ